jgi:hypothetical protein
MSNRVNAPVAAQESSHSVSDADESQDTSAIEPEQSTRRVSVWVEDSEMGPGEIQALVEANDADPLVNLTLKWISGDDQPEVWQIIWAHIPGYLLDFLPDYLRDYCPVAKEMIEVLENLGLENYPDPDEWDRLNEEEEFPQIALRPSRHLGERS